MLVKNLVNGDYFILLDEGYKRLDMNNLSLYLSQGILYNIVEELKERGDEWRIPSVWNIWIKEGENWTLKLSSKELSSTPSFPRFQVFGEPGLKLTPEQEAQAEEEFLQLQQKLLEEKEKEQQEYEQEKASYSSLIGGTVLSFELPTKNHQGYYEGGSITILGTDGQEVTVTSTHDTWEWGEYSCDSLYFE